MRRHPIETTAAKLEAVSPLLGFDIGRPQGAEWHVFDRLLAGGSVGRFIDEIGATSGRDDYPRDAAGVSLAIQLSSLTVRPAIGAYLLDRRGLDLSAGNVAIRRTPTGAFNRLALIEPRCVVLPGDPSLVDDAVGSPGVEVVADEAALRTWIADRLVAACAPLMSQIRATVSYGLNGLWCNVIDGVGAYALLLGREAGQGAEELEQTWNDASLLIDEIARLVPQIKARPQPFPVATERGATMFQVRSTCCLLYKVPSGADGGGAPIYCTTCPLIDDATRTDRITAWLADRGRSMPSAHPASD